MIMHTKLTQRHSRYTFLFLKKCLCDVPFNIYIHPKGGHWTFLGEGILIAKGNMNIKWKFERDGVPVADPLRRVAPLMNDVTDM